MSHWNLLVRCLCVLFHSFRRGEASTPCLATLHTDKRVEGQTHRIQTNGGNGDGIHAQNRGLMKTHMYMFAAPPCLFPLDTNVVKNNFWLITRCWFVVLLFAHIIERFFVVFDYKHCIHREMHTVCNSDTDPSNKLSACSEGCDVTITQSPPQAVAELMGKHRGRCSLRPVRADQLEQTGLFQEGDHKERSWNKTWMEVPLTSKTQYIALYTSLQSNICLIKSLLSCTMGNVRPCIFGVWPVPMNNVLTIPSLTCRKSPNFMCNIKSPEYTDFPTSQNVFGLDNMNVFANMLYLD